eukprot:Awhi_evm2s11901
MGVVVEIGLNLYCACYEIEGNGPMIIYTYEILLVAYTAMKNPTFAEVYKILGIVVGTGPADRAMPLLVDQIHKDKLTSIVEPAQTYMRKLYYDGLVGFTDLVDNDLLKKYDLLRVFNPRFVYLNTRVIDNDYVQQLSFLPLQSIGLSVQDLINDMQ